MVVGDVEVPIDIELGLGFAVDDHVHGHCKVTQQRVAYFGLTVFAGGGEKVHVASNVLTRLGVRLKQFRRHLGSGNVLLMEYSLSNAPLCPVVVGVPQCDAFWKLS